MLNKLPVAGDSIVCDDISQLDKYVYPYTGKPSVTQGKTYTLLYNNYFDDDNGVTHWILQYDGTVVGWMNDSFSNAIPNSKPLSTSNSQSGYVPISNGYTTTNTYGTLYNEYDPDKCPKCGTKSEERWMMQTTFKYCINCKEDIEYLRIQSK